MTGRTKLMIALAAAGVAVGVFFLLRDGDEAKATGGDGAEVAQPSRDVPGASTARRSPTRTGANDRRDLADPGDPQAADPDAPIRYEMEDGTHVTDHRGSGATPYLRPGVPHPDRALVDGKVSTEVLHQIRPLVVQCLAAAPDDAFTEDAVLMARATISIDGEGNLTAIELGADGTGIEDATLQAAISCVQAGAPNIHAHVDHAAVESAALAFPIRPLAYRR